MGIKVKHDGNATPTAFASADGGRGKRAQQDAASMAQTMQSATNAGLQQLRGASAPGAAPGRSNAQLVHATAPITGGAGVSGTRGAGLGGAGRSSSPSSGGDYKLLGGDRTDGAPTPDAFWSENSRAWMRPWRPGEKEAEALDRKLAVQEDYALSTEGRKQMDALNADIAQAVMSGRFSQEELDQLNKETDVAKKRIMYADMYRAKEPTAAETFAKNTYTDENGVVFARDGSKIVYDPNANAQKMQEREDTRYQNALLRLAQGYTVTEDQDDGIGGTKSVSVRKQYSPEEQDAILAKMFPNRYPQQEQTNKASSGDPIAISPLDPLHPQNMTINPPVSAKPQQEQTNTNDMADPKKKWAAYAN